MSISSRRITISPLSLILGIALLAVVVTHNTTAGRFMAPNGPTTVAVIDLERAVAGLSQWQVAKTEIENIGETLDEQLRQQKSVVDAAEADLDAYAPGTAEYDAAQERYSQRVIEYESLSEFFRRKIAVERARRLREVYSQIKVSLKILSIERGYDIVLVDDSKVPLPDENVGMQEITLQISARRILYSADEVDITDELIARMNNDFNTATTN
jgi:Skp family chaperone for outer membrane proteins